MRKNAKKHTFISLQELGKTCSQFQQTVEPQQTTACLKKLTGRCAPVTDALHKKMSWVVAGLEANGKWNLC